MYSMLRLLSIQNLIAVCQDNHRQAIKSSLAEALALKGAASILSLPLYHHYNHFHYIRALQHTFLEAIKENCHLTAACYKKGDELRCQL